VARVLLYHVRISSDPAHGISFISIDQSFLYYVKKSHLQLAPSMGRLFNTVELSLFYSLCHVLSLNHLGLPNFQHDRLQDHLVLRCQQDHLTDLLSTLHLLPRSSLLLDILISANIWKANELNGTNEPPQR
jgi:hypothetical protein